MPIAFLVLSLIAAPESVAGKEATYPRLHAFYYTWYGNPQTNGAWQHWNHNVILRNGSGRDHLPPDDIGANFYPADGLYSSTCKEDVERHMRQLQAAGVGVIAATWWGPNDFTDEALGVVFDAAAENNIKVCFHIEPFPGRNAATTREAIVYLLDRFGNHPALFRDAARGNRTMVYLYDSYLTPATEWAAVFTPEGDDSLRGSPYDVIAIALWVKENEQQFMLDGGFDGFYTYFATDGFTYGSTKANWLTLAAWAREHGLLFIPSVGPGYADTRVRPWNDINTRARENGAYYDRMFEAAINSEAPFLSITSFNEWHEGTQIEPAIPKRVEGFTYLDYEEQPPDHYLNRTRYWAERWDALHVPPAARQDGPR